MKNCPICNARCFDDMEICYGCMHRFDEGGNDGHVVPVEDATPMAEMPLRPMGAHEAKPAAPDGLASALGRASRRPPRKEAPRVFGAVGEDAFREPFRSSEAATGASPLQITEGPLAAASLGNGYRLVIAIEHA